MIEKKTILIVEDVALNRKVLSVILQEKYNIIEAHNGADALGILGKEEEEISLILLDIIMPVMDGFEFLKKIQKRAKWKTIPIIFVTGETYRENILEGFKMGVRDVIAKPFDPDLVRSRVDHLISLTESRERKHVKHADEPPAEIQQEEKPYTALVVEDVDVNRMMIKSCIEDTYNVLEAVHGREALHLLETHGEDIDIVLLDTVMPVMDGIEMMEEANRRGLLKKIPVIAITAEDSIPKMNQIHELGICEVIHKPFDSMIGKNRMNYMIELFREREES